MARRVDDDQPIKRSCHLPSMPRYCCARASVAIREQERVLVKPLAALSSLLPVGQVTDIPKRTLCFKVASLRTRGRGTSNRPATLPKRDLLRLRSSWVSGVKNTPSTSTS